MQTYGQENLSKKEHMKKIMDEENLDTPQDSVEFLEYV